MDDKSSSPDQPVQKKSFLDRFRRSKDVSHSDNDAVSSEGQTESNTQDKKMTFMQRMRKALSRTGSDLGNLFLGAKEIDQDLLEELETLLLMADVGIEATDTIIQSLTEKVNRKQLDDAQALKEALRQMLLSKLQSCELNFDTSSASPYVILVVGVNGVGKTTTIGKIANYLKQQGKSVMLAAGDTFRAAAVEQLQVWGERNQVTVVAQHTGADSASVIFDAVQSAKHRGIDVVIADTAGRLHNKSNLMEELKKVKRVAGKVDESAPHEVLLVLDAGTGQNAIVQMTEFDEAVGVTGIVLTKLDGTAKGGVIFALAEKFSKPIRFIGVGEGQDDLQPFSANDFVEALIE
jgi:fused signal recognition particle receptor